jgi:hypothetical protein
VVVVFTVFLMLTLIVRQAKKRLDRMRRAKEAPGESAQAFVDSGEPSPVPDGGAAPLRADAQTAEPDPSGDAEK